MSVDLADLPIFEPLSEATRRKLRPLQLHRNDYLRIRITDDLKKFILSPARLVIDPKEHLRRAILEYWHEREFPEVDIYQEAAGYPSIHARKFCAQIPEMKRGGSFQEEYFCGATDYTALMVHACWPADRLVFDSATAKTMYTFLVRRFLAQNIRAKLQAGFKEQHMVPDMPGGFVEHPDWPLSDYQRVPFMMGLGQEGIGAFMEAGTGKTAVFVNRVCEEARRKKERGEGMLRVLVVCPKKARLNWQREIEKFATCPGKICVARGGKIRRIKLLTHVIKTEEDCDFSVLVLAYDTVSQDVDILQRVEWDMIVADESHYFKNFRAKRTKAMLKLRDSAKMRAALTGTPIANTIMDLWSQLEFLGEGLSGFTSFEAFARWHGRFESHKNGQHGITKLIGIQNIPLMQERLARLTFTITEEEAGLQLPKKWIEIHEVSMTSLQQTYYTQMAHQLVIELKGELSAAIQDDSGPRTIVVNHILTKLLRLAQITSGFIKVGKEFSEDGELLKDEITKQIDGDLGNPKLSAVEELVKEDFDKDEGAKVLIWACWQEDIEALSRRLNAAGINHRTIYGKTSDKQLEDNQRAFNEDSSVRVLIATPKRAGDALNLLGYKPETAGTSEDTGMYCNHVIFYSMNWSMIEREQATKRAHRRGTRRPVRITDLVVPGTIDEEIRKRVDMKKASADMIQDVREILTKVLDLEITP